LTSFDRPAETGEIQRFAVGTKLSSPGFKPRLKAFAAICYFKWHTLHPARDFKEQSPLQKRLYHGCVRLQENFKFKILNSIFAHDLWRILALRSTFCVVGFVA
jgi:hypothetical protein